MIHRSKLECYLHDTRGVPDNCIVVKLLSGIKPKMKLFFFISFNLAVHVGTESVRIPRRVAQKLYVYLIVFEPLRRRQLQSFTYMLIIMLMFKGKIKSIILWKS